MSSSVSFRITRTAEDLAQAITALSQRLIKLEERQEALELRLRQQQQDSHRIPDQELATLDGIDQLLKETRHLLQTTDAGIDPATPSLATAPESLQLDLDQQEPKAIAASADAPNDQRLHQASPVDAEACSAEQMAAAEQGQEDDQHQRFSDEHHSSDEQRCFDEQPWQDGHHLEHQDDGGIAA